MKIVALIPALNEQNTLPALLEALSLYKQSGLLSEIIVVNDASNDQTPSILQRFDITAIHNSKRLGKFACLQKGIAQAKLLQADAVITLDGDGQHPADYLPRFIDAQKKYANHILLGVRHDKWQQAPKLRFLANQLADFALSWIAGQRLSDSQSGFRLYPSGTFEQFGHSNTASLKQGFSDESRLLVELIKQGHHCTGIAIPSIYPENRRKSYFHPLQDSLQIFRFIITTLWRTKFNVKGLYNACFGPKMTIDMDI